MLPACFHLAETVFPRVRAEAARALVASGWSQSRAAHAVGVSQAMVSKYLHRPTDEDPLIRRLAQEVQESSQQESASWCGVLEHLANEGVAQAVDRLLRAEQALLEQPPLRLLPQIGMNLAFLPSGATQPEEVVAFTGRFARAGNTMRRPGPPAVGASNHLARCLLALQQTGPDVVAIANVRGGSDVQSAAESLGHSVQVLGPGPDVDARFEAAIEPHTKVYHDPGALGIEPCLYIAGRTADDVVHTILQLHEALP